MGDCQLPGTGFDPIMLVLVAVGALAVITIGVALARRSATAVLALVLVAGLATALAAPVTAPARAADCPPATSTPTQTTPPVQNPVVTVSYLPTSDPNFCLVVVTLDGFAPDTAYTVALTYRSPLFPEQFWSYPLTTASDGSASVTPFSFTSSPTEAAEFEGVVGAVNSGFVPVSCPTGG